MVMFNRTVRGSRGRSSRAVLRSAIEACEPRRLLAASTISGAVFRDYNQNGVRDAGDKGLAGYAVYADFNGNTKLDAGEASTTTDANGSYSLGVPLQDGSKSISVRLSNVPMGSITAPSAKVYSGKFDTVQTVANQNFGLVTTTTLISGVVYDDNNGDGLRNVGDTGRVNEFVYVDLNNDGVFNGSDPSTRTDSTGRFWFYSLPDAGGTATVRPRDVSATLLTPTFRTFALNGNEGGQQLNLDFNVKVAKPTPNGGVAFRPIADLNGNNYIDSNEQSLVVGTAWIDANRNALFDAGEVELILSLEFQNYSSAKVKPGSYTIAFRRAGDADSYSDFSAPVTVTDGSFPSVTRPVSPSQQYSTVTGTIFSDANKDGVKNGSDAGLGGYTVYADVNMNGKLDAGEVSATTNASGFYTLAVPLQDGSRSISLRLANVPTASITAPIGGAHSGKFNVVLTAGNRNFGITAATPTTTTISGTIFNDANANGTLDAGEAGNGGLGISLVFADLNHNGSYDEGEPSDSLDWWNESTYTLAGVPVGQTIDVGYYAEYGSAIEGGGVFQTSPKSFTYGPRTVTTTAAPVTGADFGFATLGSISSRPVIDANKNGVADAGEPRSRSFVWLDLDNDHIYDANEPGVPSLPEGNGLPPKGAWSLAVPYGTFTVASASSATVGTLAETFVIVTTSAANPNVIAAPAVPPKGPAVTGVIYGDDNGNGVRDGDEGPLYQTIVYADYNANGIRDAEDSFTLLDSAYTSSPTYYLPVTAGRSFTLRIEEYDGPTIRTTQTYVLGALTGTQQVLNADFANPPAATLKFSTITGTVFSDGNKDGLKNGTDAGLAGYVVYADANMNGVRDLGEAFATTDANGFYTLPVPLQDGKKSISARLDRVPVSTITAPTGGSHSGKFNVVLTAGNRNFGIATGTTPTPGGPSLATY